MPSIRVAALQLQSQDEILANLSVCEYWISEAAARGAQLVVLPENFAYFGSESGRRKSAELLGDREGPIQAMLRQAALKSSIAIVAGGWPESNPSATQPYNSATLIDAKGGLVANYRKLHLFDVALPDGTEWRESAAVSAGSETVTCDLLGFRIGLSICYDLRFPELYRKLVDRGCEILCVPSAFTAETGKAHWELLVRARAVESQCWAIAANQWGVHHGGRRTYGHSMIVDPWGNVCARAESGVGIIVADITTESIWNIRDRMPCLRHRRRL